MREYNRERAKRNLAMVADLSGCIVFILYWDGSLIIDVGIGIGFVVSVVLGARGIGECNGVEEFLSGV